MIRPFWKGPPSSTAVSFGTVAVAAPIMEHLVFRVLCLIPVKSDVHQQLIDRRPKGDRASRGFAVLADCHITGLGTEPVELDVIPVRVFDLWPPAADLIIHVVIIVQTTMSLSVVKVAASYDEDGAVASALYLLHADMGRQNPWLYRGKPDLLTQLDWKVSNSVGNHKLCLGSHRACAGAGAVRGRRFLFLGNRFNERAGVAVQSLQMLRRRRVFPFLEVVGVLVEPGIVLIAAQQRCNLSDCIRPSNCIGPGE
ncbi:hypothetical protein QBC39DRAFT_358930 [Podospora conica]|nr:hypothetical protein QBC39DRAFT_358930 [Schizothecium conicum]